ncbi:protein SRC2 [Cucumis melo var. makuwa]|uniref:Protein SRC2 n=1 Tax=Cucumis melo var. makuwa TaxID=1194695 RepID=A0A5D3CW88_CUCMM|nr:protein SRC2 [Cucumis melo var. makuwa]TYK16167.1 protein SRC2 [Cucumis melo var. makuwa]
MERSMEIKIVSARDLYNVNLLMKMDVYVVVKLLVTDASGKSKPKSAQKFMTPVDKEGGSNPIWNFSVKFSVDEAAVRANCLTLVFKLRCQRNLGDRDIGEVYVPVKELLDSASEGKGDSMQHLSYQVRKPSGNPQGVLNFAFRFGENSSSGPIKPDPAHFHNPVSTYPPLEPSPVAVSHGGGYPPPPEPSLVAISHGVSYPPPTPLPPQPEIHSQPSNLYPVLPPKLAAPEIGFTAYPPPQVAAGYSVYPPPTTSYHSYAPAPTYSAYAPAPTQQSGYGYSHLPPPPTTAAYGYPPPPTYGYPPPPSYYPPPLQNKKSNVGLGMGAGLVGGMLGGLLIGDMVSDAAAGGFGDSGGFDF